MGDRIALVLRGACNVRFNLTEIRGERVLLLPGQRLIREYDDMVFEENRSNKAFQLRRQRPREIDARDGDPRSSRQSRADARLLRLPGGGDTDAGAESGAKGRWI